MNIHLIWAQDKNGGIGKDGKLPWHISQDLQNFKSLTLHSTIIMGRKTWDSLPTKPLPKRKNIVLSKQNAIESSFFYTFEKCMNYLDKSQPDKVFIIGGRSIYKLFFSEAKYLHITNINFLVQDVNEFFPIKMEIIKQMFRQVSSKQLSKNAKYTFWEK